MVTRRPGPLLTPLSFGMVGITIDRLADGARAITNALSSDVATVLTELSQAAPRKTHGVRRPICPGQASVGGAKCGVVFGVHEHGAALTFTSGTLPPLTYFFARPPLKGSFEAFSCFTCLRPQGISNATIRLYSSADLGQFLTSCFSAVRSQKQLDLVGGGPSYEPLDGFERPDATARTYQHSPDGALFAYAVPAGYVPQSFAFELS